MNYKAKVDNVNNPKDRNKCIANWIVGGIITFVVGKYIYDCFKSTKVVNIDEDKPQDEAIDNEEKLSEPDYFTKSGFMKELLDELNDEPMFGKDDISMLDYDDSDREMINDYSHKLRNKFVSVNYVESTDKSDGYVEVNIKTPEILKKDYNKKGIDSLIDKFKSLAQWLKDSDKDFRNIRISVRSLCFHPNKDEETEDMTVSQLRDLREVRGVRYINIRLFHCESEDGVYYVKELLKTFHPEGGELDNELNLMPIIFITEDGCMAMPKRNSLAEAILGIK